MPDQSNAFREFERQGWESDATCKTYDVTFANVTRQSIGALLDDARIEPGLRVLDVCTGGGYVAGEAALRGAEAYGVDFAQAQIELARQRYPGVTFRQGDAESLPYPDAHFDAVVNCYGMCHLPNPDRAMTEAFRVLRSGGRFAFAVSDTPDAAAAFKAVYGAIQAQGTLEVGLPVGPSYFHFSEPAVCTERMGAAGFVDVSVRQVPQLWRVPSADSVIECMLKGTVRAAATLKAQDSRVRETIYAAIREALHPYEVQTGLELPMPAIVATGVKP